MTAISAADTANLLLRASRLCAPWPCWSGVLLDPVYTGKAMAALIDAVQKTPSLLGDTVVFLHTGGAHALHGYPADFSNPQRPNDEGKS